MSWGQGIKSRFMIHLALTLLKEEKNMKMMWIILAVNTFLSVTALRGLWNLIERVDNLQEWVEMLIGEASDVPDFTFKELGEIVREGRER